METKNFTAKALDLGYHATFNAEGDLHAAVPANIRSLTVEVSLPTEMFGKAIPATIQTVGWGDMPAEGITEVIRAYENAQAMVALIDEFLASN